jgi:hypothetical protein
MYFNDDAGLLVSDHAVKSLLPKNTVSMPASERSDEGAVPPKPLFDMSTEITFDEASHPTPVHWQTDVTGTPALHVHPLSDSRLVRPAAAPHMTVS